MSIEDIDYLKENSEKDSCIMYIDSALRNRDKFAKPNQYVIPLDEPFRYVYGVDVLDASIPSSMFNIDINNNDVRAGIYEVNETPNYETGNNVFIGLDGQLKEPDPDHPTSNDFQLLFNELGGVDGFDDILTNTDFITNSKPFTYKTIYTTRRLLTAAYYRRNFVPPEIPPEDDALLTFANIEEMFYSPAANGSKYLLVVRETLPTEQSVFILNANELKTTKIEWSLDTSYEYPVGVFTPRNTSNLIAAPRSRSRINGCRVLTFVNRKLDRQPNIVYVHSLLTDVPELPTTSRPRYSMYFEFTKNGKSYYIQYKNNWDASFLLTANARSFIDRIHQNSAYPDVKLVDKLLYEPTYSYSVQPPNGKDILSYTFQIYRVYCVTYDSFDGGGSKNGFERIVSNNAIYLQIGFQLFILNPGNYGITNFLTEIKRAFQGSGIDIENGYTDDILIRPNLRFSSAIPFFFDMDRSTLRTVMGFDELAYENNGGYYNKVFYKDNNRLFGCLPVPVLNNVVFKIISPGVVYLLGTRYCILRCEELDDHMYGSRAYGRFSPGIALFKMFNVNDVAHQRLDFVNLKKKPFHPIGKLDKMTFRFETSDGSLYDFKGANHLLVISIKYYVPSQKRTFTQSVLNPNYNSDFASYFLGRSVAYKENSDDDVASGEEEVPNDKKSNSFVNRFVKKEISYCAEDDSDSADNVESAESGTVSSEFDFA